MVDPGLLDVARALPKIELHRHLEGSVRLSTLVKIAQEYGIEMPEYDEETLRPFVQMIPGEPRNMQHFLAKFLTLRQFFRSLDIVAEIAREVVIDAALDNVKYMELRFTPPALANLIEVSYDEIVRLVCETTRQTAAEYDIQIGLIVSMNRHESVEIGEQVLDAALKHRDKGVVALDLAGREPGFSALPFRNVFRRAKSEGLWVTIHAGEWDGAQSVWDAVGNLYADRVGHGIRAMEDPGIVSILAERGVTLEVCPSSNVDSGVVEKLEVHPLHKLDRSGVLTTINTDDPLVCNITLSDEIARVMHEMGFTMEDIKRQTIQAAQCAFLPDLERDALVKRFENWLSAVPLPVSDKTP